jgi:hypothetical protein
MSGNDREREERVLDALLISALRREEAEVEIDPTRLPKLTDEERAAMGSLSDDFLDKILSNDATDCSEESPLDCGDEDCEEDNNLALAGSGVGWGLNRAEVIDALTAEELEQKKKEILERIAKAKLEKGGGGD